MRYWQLLLFSSVLMIMAVTDYLFGLYNILSVLVIIIAAAMILVSRKRIIELEDDALVSGDEQ